MTRSLRIILAAVLTLGGCRAPRIDANYVQPQVIEGRLFNDYPGVIHVHGEASHDSQGSLRKITEDARQGRCRFLVMTDHDSLAWKRFEGLHEGLLLLVGNEVSTDDGHLLVLDDGAYAVIAHPTLSKKPWTAWPPAPGIAGMEVYNVFADAYDESWPMLLLKLLLVYPFFPNSALAIAVDRPAQALDRWDGLLQERPFVGLAGSDAHGSLKLLWRNLDSYAAIFAVVRTHVLAEDLTATAVHEALRGGRCYLSFDAWRDATGFAFLAHRGQRRHTMGEVLPAGVPTLFSVETPAAAHIALLRDGRRIKVKHGRRLIHADDRPGVYRVEVSLRPAGSLWLKPWIISNPIYIRKENRHDQRP